MQIMRLISTLLLVIISNAFFAQSTGAPNFVFIFCDDLDVSGLGLYDDGQAITPYMDTLSHEGFAFTNAHTNAPICGPSRACVFTGVLPATSGHFGFSMGQFDWRENPVLSETTSIFGHFKENGYKVYAAGKIFHQNRNRLSDFDDLNLNPFQGPAAFGARSHSDLPASFTDYGISFAPLENVPSYPEGDGWYAKGQPFFFESDENRDLLGDEISALYLDSILEANSGNAEPLFITLGMYSPHQPFHAPEKYFDLYPLDSIDLSRYQDSELDDIKAAYKNRFNADSNLQLKFLISEAPEEDSLLYIKQFIQGYYAGVSFLDEQVGAVLKSIDEHGYADNTYVILTSDHGYHLGTRQIIKKTTLWNDASNIPLIIRGPGIPSGSSSGQPVSLVDVYPTLTSLANIPLPDHELDGKRLDVILNNPLYSGTLLSAASTESLEIDQPGTPSHQHHAILVGEYKYILYSSGEDELYNLANDPNELNDLSNMEAFQKERGAFYNLIASKIEGARKPTEDFQKLFYGDFEQNLNGWNPSAEEDQIQISQGTDVWDSKNVVLKTTTKSLRNTNVKIDETGFYELRIVGFSDNGDASVRVSLADEVTSQNVVFNEIFELTSTPELKTFTFFSEAIQEDLVMRIRKLDGADIHIDNVSVFNTSAYDLALTKCTESELINSNVAFSMIQADSLKYKINQRKIDCSDISSLSRQLWYRFEPLEEQGIIVCRTTGPSNPIIEVWEACDSDSVWKCADVRSDKIETLMVESLTPGQEYIARIADSNQEFRDFTQVSSLYQDITKAKVTGVSPTGLTLNNLPYSNFSVETVTFRVNAVDGSIEDQDIVLPFEPSGLYSSDNFDFPPGEYNVSVAYELQPLNIVVPFGEDELIENLGNSVNLWSGNDQLSVYPNPLGQSANTLFLSSEVDYSDQLGQIILTDLSGKQISEWNNHALSHGSSLQLPGSLSQGIYFLRITPTDGSTYTMKVIVD